MRNLYKRNRTYYIRLNINNDLLEYFNNQKLYIKSLGITNKLDATIIVKYLVSQFNFIKKNIMLLKTEEVKNIINDFKNLNYNDILNRNHNLSLIQIDKQLEQLKEPLTVDSTIIKDELYDLMQLAHINYDKDSLIDMDIHDVAIFIDYIKKFKSKALTEIKNKINSHITIEQKEAIETIKEVDNGITINNAIDEFLNSRKDMHPKSLKQSTTHIEQFQEYCKLSNLIYIKNLKNKDIVGFRDNLKMNKPNAKTSTINNTLTSIKTFCNYCLNTAHYLQYNITTNIMLKKSIKERVEDGVEGWTHQDISNLFKNIKILTHHKTQGIPLNYANEYAIIIKIAMYTGARESEIIQLTKDDIKFSEEYNTWYLDFNINDDKFIKTISSIRRVPIHKTLEPELLEYIKPIRKNLFTIKTANFAKKFSDYKTKLGYPKSKKVFHSFRHTLSNELKQNLTDNVLLNEITGHAQDKAAKMSETYTNKYTLDILMEHLNKVKYNLE